MNVLLINKFLYPKGGDAVCTLSTGELLSSKGHAVSLWGMDHPSNPPNPLKEYFIDYVDLNSDAHAPGAGQGRGQSQFKTAMNILYSFEAKAKIEKVIQAVRPDIVHLNNFAHQISPSVLHVLRAHHIPTVMTMHDYKLGCPTYSMLMDEKPCERCRGQRFYNCLLTKCSKGSRAKSLVNTIEMYLHHKVLRIYDLIDIYIAPSLFMKSKIEEMGFKADIRHLPNCIDTDVVDPQYEHKERAIVYFGRLSAEKGLTTLIDAVKGVPVRLKIIGEGPQKAMLIDRAKEHGIKNVDFMGYKTGKDLYEQISKSMFVVLPSECYENNPRSLIEAFALGKPAVGARIGGIPELVKDFERGLTFKPGNVEDLRLKIEHLINHPNKIVEMGKKARAFAAKELNTEKHYTALMAIYADAVAKHGQRQGIGPNSRRKRHGRHAAPEVGV